MQSKAPKPPFKIKTCTDNMLHKLFKDKLINSDHLKINKSFLQAAIMKMKKIGEVNAFLRFLFFPSISLVNRSNTL